MSISIVGVGLVRVILSIPFSLFWRGFGGHRLWNFMLLSVESHNLTQLNWLRMKKRAFEVKNYIFLYSEWLLNLKKVVTFSQRVRIISTFSFQINEYTWLKFLDSDFSPVIQQAFVTIMCRNDELDNGLCQTWWNTGPLFGLFLSSLSLYFTMSDIVHELSWLFTNRLSTTR